MHAGKISAEEAIDKSKNPGQMMDKMQRAGIAAKVDDEALQAEAAESREASPGGAAPAAAAAVGANAAAAEAERQAVLARNRARMMAMQGKA
jgi:hypothetical protein